MCSDCCHILIGNKSGDKKTSNINFGWLPWALKKDLACKNVLASSFLYYFACHVQCTYVGTFIAQISLAIWVFIPY